MQSNETTIKTVHTKRKQAQDMAAGPQGKNATKGKMKHSWQRVTNKRDIVDNS
jgi:hypothetical protein